MSLISLAWTHWPSSGMGAGPWYAPLATGHMFSTSCEYCMPLLSFVVAAGRTVLIPMDRANLTCSFILTRVGSPAREKVS